MGGARHTENNWFLKPNISMNIEGNYNEKPIGKGKIKIAKQFNKKKIFIDKTTGQKISEVEDDPEMTYDQKVKNRAKKFKEIYGKRT